MHLSLRRVLRVKGNRKHSVRGVSLSLSDVVASFKRPMAVLYLEIIIPGLQMKLNEDPFTDGIKMGSHSANRKSLHSRVSMTSHPTTLPAGKRSDISISVNKPLKLYRGLLLLIKWTFFTLFQSLLYLYCVRRDWRQWRPAEFALKGYSRKLLRVHNGNFTFLWTYTRISQWIFKFKAFCISTNF